MKALILDCSAAMVWCFTNTYDALAEETLEFLYLHPTVVPQLWSLEIANTILQSQRRKRLSAREAQEFIELLEKLTIHVDDSTHQNALSKTLHLAQQYTLSAYDAAYLELALRLHLPLATRDKALENAAQQSGVSLFGKDIS